MQPALQSAFDNGDTNAVIELANMYKKDKGIALVTLETPAAPAAPVVPVVPAGADGLLPVSSRRAIPTPRGTPDPFDYETAFKEAADAAG